MTEKQNRLSPYLSPLSVWALAVGTSVDWGSMVVTCNTYLKQAGPVGSIAGLLIGGGSVVASLGIADYDPAQDHRFHDVFTRADKAMYDRKLALKAMGSVTRD